MTLEGNRADLERHARDFAARSGFTYTVLDPSDRSVIGCVYIYPDRKPGTWSFAAVSHASSISPRRATPAPKSAKSAV